MAARINNAREATEEARCDIVKSNYSVIAVVTPFRLRFSVLDSDPFPPNGTASQLRTNVKTFFDQNAFVDLPVHFGVQ